MWQGKGKLLSLTNSIIEDEEDEEDDEDDEDEIEEQKKNLSTKSQPFTFTNENSKENEIFQDVYTNSNHSKEQSLIGALNLMPQ